MGKYVIIGGSSGIGKAVVNMLAEQGNSVFTTFNQHPIESSGNIQSQKLDVRHDTLDLSEFPDELDGLVYCPGSINLKPFHRFTGEDFVEDFRLQVVGAAKVIQQLLPKLKKSENASIVLFSTIAVQQGFNFHSQVAISKGAIEGLVRSLSAEFAPKIRVNAIAPSLTDTPLGNKFLNTSEKAIAQAAKNPLKKVGKPADIASAAIYLLTPGSSWITGQILHVDGGYSSIKN